MLIRFSLHPAILAAAIGAIAFPAALPALGQTDFTMDASIYNNISYQQTSDAPPALAGYWFSVGANSDNGGVYDTATATYPGPASPLNLPAAPGTAGTSNAQFNYSTPFYNTETDLHSDFPFGTYNFAVSGASGSVQANIDYSADAFTNTLPLLANFDQLAGMNPSQNLTVNFPSFTPDPSSTEGFAFFTVRDPSGNAVADGGFMDPSTSSFTIPANSLLPNTTYTFELDYSDRIDGQDAVNNQFTEQGFDQRDDGTFTTGDVPSPSSGIQIVGLALLAVSSKRCRTSRRSSL